MLDRPSDCITCPANSLAQGFVKPEGKAKLGVAIFGEKAGPHEIQEEGPLRANSESGSLITHIIEKHLKLSRGDFVWDLAVKCRPVGDKIEGTRYEKDVVSCCNGYNGRSIGRRDVKVVLALGSVAFRALTGIEGKKRDIQNARGYVYQASGGSYLVVPSLDPAFIRKGASRYTPCLVHDLKRALDIASGKDQGYELAPSYKAPKFVMEGKAEALVSFYYRMRDNPTRTIFYDIETPWSTTAEEDEKGEEDEEEQEKAVEREEEADPYVIRSIQFTDCKDWAITVPWEKPFIKVALRILALPNPKSQFNGWHFDDPRLRRNGAEIGGTVHDIMWAWHHWQPGLDKGLQKVASFHRFPYPWKHLALEADKEDEYGGSDVIALAYIWEKLPATMRQRGVWESYLRYKVGYREVLARVEARGVPIHEGERQTLTAHLQEGIANENVVLQQGVPEELRNISPKRKNKETGQDEYGYKREPREIKELRAGYDRTREAILSRGVHSSRIISFEKWASSKTGLSYREFGRVDEEFDIDYGLFDGIGSPDGGGEPRGYWCRVKPFKASSQQLIRYMKFKGYKVPVTLKTKKETTGKKELLEVYETTQDEVLRSAIKIRSMGKMLSNDVPNWTPSNVDSDGNGTVHTTFKFDPPSWQLNSVGPNIQNARKHEPDAIARELELGLKFRKIVKAPPGRCIIEFDKRSFHVSMMGYEARDPLYLKWSKVDMHTLITSYIVGEAISLEGEPDLEKIGWIKKHYKVVRDTQGKPTVLGNQLGLGAHKLWQTNKTYVDEHGIRRVGIENRRKAEWLQQLLADLFPITHKYKQKIKERAHFQTYLLSEYGAIRHFHDVMRWDYGKRMMRNGIEAEQAQSHNTQADAFGMIHDEILDMAYGSDALEEFWFCNTIHDSVVMVPEWRDRDRCIEVVRGFMNKPSGVLRHPEVAPDGLVVEVDVSMSCEGGNWASYHKDRNPEGLKEVKA